MLAVTVICIGKLKESFFREAAAEYQKRLSRFCSFNIKELAEAPLPENPSDAQVAAALKKEGEAVINEIPSGAYSVALCVEGKQLSSPELAEKIEGVALSGKSNVCFIIGSSFGLSDEVKQKCDLKLSFSKMTFPHQLFRVLLLEQIYRAFSITNKMKYHK
ncbi:MAG: 23S rRNA (pseudouridine(1915)-N(3))-methyltransferase RlmH [Oscillospiraceae bacterium]|nr:23S rRNA (pseudouridine(1915)-N(3))-methyltransferase RlmH [Oscillospiraceae bacterium]